MLAKLVTNVQGLCLDECLDILQDRDSHNHIEGATPVDMENELHASGFVPFSVRTDIRDIDIRVAKMWTAKGFVRARQTAEFRRKFCGRYDHCGVQVDGRRVEILANSALLTPIQHTKRVSHIQFLPWS